MTELLQIATPTTKSLNDNWSQNIRDHFPFDLMRDAQDKGAEAILRAYRENKKFIIIEGPPGAGKSGIGVMAASYAKTQPSPSGKEAGAYILSPQKSLTAQYMNDFGKMGLVELKGRSNYECTEFVDEDNKPVDCEIGGMLCKEKGEDGEGGGCSFCPYKEAKLAFTRSAASVTNFAYYLNETYHAGQLLPRRMLVLDEGHNLEQQILSLADIVVTRFRCDEVGVNFFTMAELKVKPGQTEKGATWVRDTYKAAASALIMKWEADLREFKEDHDTASAAKLGKKLNGIKRFVGMIDLFLNSVVNNPKDWIVYTDDTKGSDTYGCLIIKPLTATLFANDILFSKADKIVIMSATIGGTDDRGNDFTFFMRNLGIDPKDAVTLRLPCDFPVENRPVFIKPIANMSSSKVGCPNCSTEENKGASNRKGSGCDRCYGTGQVPSIDYAMPLVAAFLSKIMEHKNYAGKKGLVHTHSYKVNKYMSENLSPENIARVVTHTNAKGSRDSAIVNHCEATNPTVLFSPSMTEGLDLKDDLSRFSVIVKVPFPFLDPYVKARMERDSEWYAWLVALAIIQGLGRSNRHKEDKAHHYILDSAILAFLARYEHLFPKWFMDAVVRPR
jgi:Rad3-related DNA helicase